MPLKSKEEIRKGQTKSVKGKIVDKSSQSSESKAKPLDKSSIAKIRKKTGTKSVNSSKKTLTIPVDKTATETHQNSSYSGETKSAGGTPPEEKLTINRPQRDDLAGVNRRSPPPYQSVGGMTTVISHGYILETERNRALAGTQKYTTYANLINEVTVVSASVDWFKSLIKGAKWIVEPAERDNIQAAEVAELFEKILMEDPRTPWAEIQARASMSRLFGFSLQTWTARKSDDGSYNTLLDIVPRGASTIERWDVDRSSGEVLGVVQRPELGADTIYIPRNRLVYLAERSITDSPEGLGLMRLVAEDALRLQYYQRLLTLGLEKDLRGVAVGKFPYSEIEQYLSTQEPYVSMATDEERNTAINAEIEKRLKPLKEFAQRAKKNNETTGLILDSLPYFAEDTTTGRLVPSPVAQYGLELLTGDGSGLQEILDAIDSLKKDIARVWGTSGIFLGDNNVGSYSLSQDRTSQFHLMVESQLEANRVAFQRDIVKTFMELNDIPMELEPNLKVEGLQSRDPEQVRAAFDSLFRTGTILPNDEIINEFRAQAGFSELPPEQLDVIADQIERERAQELALAGRNNPVNANSGPTSGGRNM